jgi:hypothetical protein
MHHKLPTQIQFNSNLQVNSQIRIFPLIRPVSSMTGMTLILRFKNPQLLGIILSGLELLIFLSLMTTKEHCKFFQEELSQTIFNKENSEIAIF